jgi:hypothetical protein
LPSGRVERFHPVYENANYYDSDSKYVNTAQELDKTIMICQTVNIQNEKVNVCLDYGSRLQGGLVFGGSVSSHWRSKASISRKVPAVMALLGLMMAILVCFGAPAQAFVYYDKKAQRTEACVERGMLNRAEDKGMRAKEFPAILTKIRQNERCNFRRSLCKKEAGVDEEVAAPVPERGQDGEWKPLSNEANGFPKIF